MVVFNPSMNYSYQARVYATQPKHVVRIDLRHHSSVVDADIVDQAGEEKELQYTKSENVPILSPPSCRTCSAHERGLQALGLQP